MKAKENFSRLLASFQPYNTDRFYCHLFNRKGFDRSSDSHYRIEIVFTRQYIKRCLYYDIFAYLDVDHYITL